MGRQRKYKTETKVVQGRIEKPWAEVIKIIPKISKEHSNESEIVRKSLLYFLNEKIPNELLEKAFNEAVEKGSITEEEIQLLKP